MPELTYFGHSAFMLGDGENTVLIDPFIADNPKATHNPDELQPNTILLTHAHNDHVGDTVPIARRTEAKVIATHELATWLQQDHEVGNVVGGNHGGTIAFDGGTVKFTPAWHTSSYRLGNQWFAPGLPAGLVIRFGGKTIYFSGDTALFSDMKLIGEEGLDVAVLCIGDHFTMGPVDAARAVEFLNPKVVVPCHYNTFPPIEQDAEEFKRLVESRTRATVEVLEPGQSLRL